MNLIKMYPDHHGLLKSLNPQLIEKLKKEADLDKKLRDTQFRVRLMFLNTKGDVNE